MKSGVLVERVGQIGRKTAVRTGARELLLRGEWKLQQIVEMRQRNSAVGQFAGIELVGRKNFVEERIQTPELATLE